MKIAEGKHYLSLGCNFVAVGVTTAYECIKKSRTKI